MHFQRAPKLEIPTLPSHPRVKSPPHYNAASSEKPYTFRPNYSPAVSAEPNIFSGQSLLAPQFLSARRYG